MKKQDYKASIVVNAGAMDSFNNINKVSAWWTEDITGKSDKLNDSFAVHFGETFVDFKTTQLVPGKKVEWLVTECYLPWLQDKQEWTNTRVVFDITTEDKQTKIEFTHAGLVPEVECYDGCVKGWDRFFKSSLYQLIMEGQGLPQRKKETKADLAV